MRYCMLISVRLGFEIQLQKYQSTRNPCALSYRNIYLIETRGRNCLQCGLVPSSAGKWNQHPHKACRQREVLKKLWLSLSLVHVLFPSSTFSFHSTFPQNAYIAYSTPKSHLSFEGAEFVIFCFFYFIYLFKEWVKMIKISRNILLY